MDELRYEILKVARKLFVLLFAGNCVACSHVGLKSSPSLTDPFLNLAPQREPAPANEVAFLCPAVPPPIIDVMGLTYYKDSHHSIIDPERLKQSREMAQPLRVFSNQIAALADTIWVQDNKPAEECLQRWLLSWAKADAMLGKVNYQGEFERKWFLAGISLAYLRVENLVQWESNNRSAIVDWFDRIGQQVRTDYQQQLEKQSRHNNHVYWAALAIMASSIAANDRDLYNWALIKAKQGAMDVTTEGFLPLELERARRAWHYQSFALQALTMLAFLAEKNGTDLYSVNNESLRRLAETTLAGYTDCVFR